MMTATELSVRGTRRVALIDGALHSWLADRWYSRLLAGSLCVSCSYGHPAMHTQHLVDAD
jgi:hypothetical protein